MAVLHQCPSCASDGISSFYRVAAVPTNSCLLIHDRTAALGFPVGAIDLCWCRECGFIFNAAWEPARTTYSQAYEETQGFSATFNTFHERLARDLIRRHDLQRKTVVEIGCGKGDFLALLCRLGNNEGVGFDPSFVPSRLDPEVASHLRFVQEFFDESTELASCSAVVCTMTLEHIPDVGRFLSVLRSALEEQPDTLVFVQVPNMGLILESGAFWDVYYEHCSYFTAESLANAFRRAGFLIDRVWADYDDQYLMIEARAASEPTNKRLSELERAALERQIRSFVATVEASKAAWNERLRDAAFHGKRVALWGSGSKAVAFLTTLGLKEEVVCAVDINPFRQGHYLPSTGHSIISPDDLTAISPDSVVVMNPVYRAEVQTALRQRGCDPELHTL